MLKVLLAIAQIYSRQIETGRYLWTLKQRLDSLLSRCTLGSSLKAYQSMLKLQSFILTHLYVYALNYEEHLLILDDTTVTLPSSNCNHSILPLYRETSERLFAAAPSRPGSPLLY